MKSKEKKEKFQDVIFWIGILCFILSISYIKDDISVSLFFAVITVFCYFKYRKTLHKVLSKKIIQRIYKLKVKEKNLLKEIDILQMNKDEIQNYTQDKESFIQEINQYKETINNLFTQKNELVNKENELKNNISNLEIKKENMEKLIEQENVISRAIESEKTSYNLISNQVKELKEQKNAIQSNLKRLTKKEATLEERLQFKEKYNISYIDTLNGIEFENFIAILLKYLGYDKSEVTQKSNDYGVDLVAEKDNIRYAIQCKNYSQPVGNSAIQEAYSGKDYYDCHVAIVATNNYYTSNAIKQAKMNKVVLWDRNKLKEMLNTLI